MKIEFFVLVIKVRHILVRFDASLHQTGIRFYAPNFYLREVSSSPNLPVFYTKRTAAKGGSTQKDTQVLERKMEGNRFNVE